MKISSCLIAKNEAANIGRCLESVKSISDEIIVVDTGSTDNTVEIAKSFGAKVYFYEWDNNFSSAKNYALDKASGDWIIFLDADEYFDAKTRKILVDTLKKILDEQEYDALLCRMINTDGYNGKKLSENPTVRIFRGNRDIRYKGAVHEQLVKQDKNVKIIHMKDLPLIIYHTGYSSNLLPEKTKRNLKILEDEVKNNIITNQTYYHISAMHSNLNNYDEAIRYAMMALEEPTFNDTIFAYKPYTIIINSMLHLKEKYSFEDINKYIEEAAERFPYHPEIWYAIGNAYKEYKNYPLAIESYLKAIECDKNYSSMLNNNFPAYLDGVYNNLAYMSLKIGDKVMALQYYFDSLKINKYNTGSLRGLYELIKNQEPEEIVLFFKNIYNMDNKDDLVFLNAVMADLGNKVLANYYYVQHERKFS